MSEVPPCMVKVVQKLTPVWEQRVDEFHQDEKNDKFLADLESPEKTSKSSAAKKVHSLTLKQTLLLFYYSRA